MTEQLHENLIVPMLKNRFGEGRKAEAKLESEPVNARSLHFSVRPAWRFGVSILESVVCV